MAQAGGQFPHLPLPALIRGRALLRGGGGPHPDTEQAKNNRQGHSAKLTSDLQSEQADWNQRRAVRGQAAPPLPTGVPLLLKVEPDTDLDWLISGFDLEIISEEEDGYVIVASSDEELTKLLQKLNAFPQGIQGSAGVARIHTIGGNQDRIRRVLKDDLLFARWTAIQDEAVYTVDVGIQCRGSQRYPARPVPKPAETDKEFRQRLLDYAQKQPDKSVEKYAKRYPQKPAETDQQFQVRLDKWNLKVRTIEDEWEQLKDDREEEFQRFIYGGGGHIGPQREAAGRQAGVSLPDSLEARITVPGKLLKDLVLNYPLVFEVAEPPDIENPFPSLPGHPHGARFTPKAPHPEAPIVGVIDSGIQTGHRLLAPACPEDSGISYVPDQPDELADRVAAGGHGTRVAGAVLYRESIPTGGDHQLPAWLYNIRVLDEDKKLSDQIYPPQYIQRVAGLAPRVRLFNQSINTHHACDLKHASAWAAAMDLAAYERDVLFVQSVGNLPPDGGAEDRPGIRDHLAAGQDYPAYLLESTSRIAEPAESLHSLSVGSVAYRPTAQHCFGQADHPSAFSRSGLGIWDSVKPDVVEYGGDWVHDGNVPRRLLINRDSCPELVRSNLHASGPATERDTLGTSFAAPKVAHLAALLQAALPQEPCLLYRALIAQSARWPEHAPATLETVRHYGYGIPQATRATENSPFRITLITSGTQRLVGGDAHIFQIPVPIAMRRPEMTNKVRIDITLSYAARPRRTRRTVRRYLSTWLTWEVSDRNETFESFRGRI